MFKLANYRATCVFALVFFLSSHTALAQNLQNMLLTIGGEAHSTVALPSSTPINVDTFTTTPNSFYQLYGLLPGTTLIPIGSGTTNSFGLQTKSFDPTNAVAPPQYSYYKIDLIGLALSPFGISNLLNMLFISSAPRQGLTQRFFRYIGGPGASGFDGIDRIRDVAIGQQGHIYLTGATGSPSYPTTDGTQVTRGHQAKYPDVFLTILDQQGNILYSTVFGGRYYDRAYAIEVNPLNGDVYLAGRAGPEFQTCSNCFQPNFIGTQGGNAYGPQNGFICLIKKIAAGFAAPKCSYISASSNIEGGIIRDIAIANVGNNTEILVTGGLNSAVNSFAFPTTFKRIGTAGSHGAIFVANIDPDLEAVNYVTVLSSHTGAILGSTAIRSDSYAGQSARPVVITSTTATNLPTTTGPNHSGGSDIYIFKLTPNGQDIAFSRYIGGLKQEHTETHNLAVGLDQKIYFSFTTNSEDILGTVPLTGYGRSYHGPAYGAGSHITTNYYGDAMIGVLDPKNGNATMTYVGGSSGDGTEGIVVDPQGTIYATISTSSSDFPVTNGSRLQGTYDGALVKLHIDPSAGAATLLYSGYMGLGDMDFARSIAIDQNGKVVAGGSGVRNGSFDSMIQLLEPQ
ncbi:hypothetical protein OAO01_01585 [Oligoflexia bacterium]|nr:hypothetical protein [Oligoflexia bacterium]